MKTISADEFTKRYGQEATTQFAPTTQQEPGYVSRVGSQIANNFSDSAQKLSSLPTMPTFRQEVGAGLNVAKNVTASALAPIAEAPGFKQVAHLFGDTGKVISDVFMKSPQYATTFDKLAAFLDKNPEVGDAFATANNVLALEGLSRGVGAVSNTTKAVANTTADTLAAAKSQIGSTGQGLRTRVQSLIAKKTVNPQLESAATRMKDSPKPFLEGTKSTNDPVTTYDTYLAQSEKAIADIKQDPAISTVGEEIGDAFRDIVRQRQAVGSLMGSELKKFGGKPVDMKSPVGAFQRELIDNGAAYDAFDKRIIPGSTSKFSSADVSLLDKYATELSSLGKTPTAAQLDAFVSRIQREIKELKASKGINFQTNAERIITGNVAEIRNALKTVATKQYNNARSTYSDLSDFVEEGSDYLGKITQSGDFARDASLAKSSVQSILNNGKKDWLMQLEDLSGRQLLDKAVLALQAMADAGDFRGLSLLQKLSEGGSIPMTKTGILGKVLDYAAHHGARAIVGSPAEQTRQFLLDLTKKP